MSTTRQASGALWQRIGPLIGLATLFIGLSFASPYFLTVDNQLNVRTGTIRGRAVLDNKEGLFTPGMFARTPAWWQDRLLIETDSPYLAPQPVRGRTNEPAFVNHTLTALAEARGEDAAEDEGAGRGGGSHDVSAFWRDWFP